MSDSDTDEPQKKPPQPTLQWDPAEEERDEAAEGDARGSAGAGEGERPRPVTHGEPTVAMDSLADSSRTDVDPLVGQLLRGKWRVLARLGAGSYGTVYKVQDVNGGWIEALKILAVDRIPGADAANVRARFLREAQIMKRLGTQSRHIVDLGTYEEDVEAGLVYFLMEFVDGRSLSEALAQDGPFSVEKTIRLALQVCEALTVAHEGADGVVHRDLKLENIMLAPDGAGEEIAKVLDFGIAKVAEREPDSRLTTVGTLGTPGYAAPEQLRAEDVDARTDLFAFGVILYALLTGRDPWMGNPAGQATHQVYELMVATERAEVKPMASTGVAVPPEMVEIVMRLLRRNPDERFASARELEAALRRVAEGGGAREGASGAAGGTGATGSGAAAGSTVATGPGTAADPGTHPASDTGSTAARPPATRPAATGSAAATGTTSRSRGARIPLLAALLALLLAGAAGAAWVKPWGRTLDLAELGERARAGGVTDARLTPRGIEGRVTVAGLPVRFRTPMVEGDIPGALEELGAAGLSVDPSWEVERLVGMAALAQGRLHYFGREGEDVQGYAERAAALNPDGAEARSLLLKVAERMGWDAEAAAEEGSVERAQALARDCLRLVPGHERCAAVTRSDER